MEKQRIKRLIRSGRRFLISLFLISSTVSAFSQNISLEEIKKLRIVPAEGQNLYTKTDLRFIVTIPNVRPAQIQVTSTNQQQDIVFRTMRKSEDYEQNGTLIEIWYNFDKKGDYKLSPISLLIQNRKRSISFEPVTITDDPAKMNPRIVIVFEDGTTIYSDDPTFQNPLLNISTGKKLHFTVNIQYATQLVQFSWDIPKDSIFTCTKQYEFTEIRQRERVYSHVLIPVADFEWTGLVSGPQSLPKVKLNAAAYNGSRNELIFPEVVINFTETSETLSQEKTSDIFAAAFYQEQKTPEEIVTPSLTKEECQQLCSLYSKEHNLFITYLKARKDRINFEQEHGIVVSASPIFPGVLLYVSLLIILSSTICMIIAIRKKHRIRTLLFVVLLIMGTAILIYCAVRRSERYGISAGCKIYSIPQENAESVFEVASGNRVRILERTEKWYYIEVGETGGWCTADSIFIIR